MITPIDPAELVACGIDAEPDIPSRPAFAVERALQAAQDEQLVATVLDTHDDGHIEADIVLDSRPLTDPEARALVHLIANGHVKWCGPAITLTMHGRDLLQRWASYVPRPRHKLN